jgi:hypothetical protein
MGGMMDFLKDFPETLDRLGISAGWKKVLIILSVIVIFLLLIGAAILFIVTKIIPLFAIAQTVIVATIVLFLVVVSIALLGICLYQKFKKAKLWYLWAISIIILPGIFFLLLFLEPPFKKFIDDGIRTPTPTATLAPTNTITSQPSLSLDPTATTIPTITLEPTETTPLPTQRPPFSEFAITNDCIPLGWKLLSGRYIPSDQKCLPLEKTGITAVKNGLNFLINPNSGGNIQTLLSGTSYYLNGIYMPVPKDIQVIKFNLRINEVNPSINDMDTVFFFGTISPDNISFEKSYGNFVAFLHVTMGSAVDNLIRYVENPIVSPKLAIAKFPIREDQEIVIIFSDIDYSIQIRGNKYPQLQNLPYPPGDYNFAIGYVVPLDYGLSVSISELQFNP